MKRNDWIILLVVLVVGAALYLTSGRRLPGAAAPLGEGYVLITVPGQTARQVALDKAQDIVIEQPDGQINVVAVIPGGFYMKESNCKNQDCVHQGTVTLDNLDSRALYDQVICLPNKVVLRLVSGADEPAETLEILP